MHSPKVWWVKSLKRNYGKWYEIIQNTIYRSEITRIWTILQANNRFYSA